MRGEICSTHFVVSLESFRIPTTNVTNNWKKLLYNGRKNLSELVYQFSPLVMTKTAASEKLVKVCLKSVRCLQLMI